MIYPNLTFPEINGRPFFYTNFVESVDGKVQVFKNTKGYWPIGSEADHDTLIELRSYADALVHGAHLAREFGDISQESLGKAEFKSMRQSLGKNPDLPYYVVTNQPEEFTGKANVVSDLSTLVKICQEKGYKNVLVEGGPTLLGSFLKEHLMDEVFLTIAPKIFGNEDKQTITLVEGVLFPPQDIKYLKLISIHQVRDEVFLRYSIRNTVINY